MYNDTMMYFVFSGTLTNNGDVAVRPTDHLIGELSFDGYNTLYTLKPKMPSEVEEAAPGETAEVTLYTSESDGIKKGYIDGHAAFVRLGWAEDLSEINLDLKGYEAFESIEEVYPLSLGKIK